MLMTPAHSETRASAAPPLEEGARVLIVDDERANRDMLQRRLERHGFVVTSVEGGQQALDEVSRSAYDVVLLDVMMPGLSGLETLRRLRTTHSASELPVVMATARDLSEDVVEALGLGANDYITKPIDFAIALARIKAHVLAGRSARRLRVSEERYALAAKCDNGGLWDWNLQTGALFVNHRWLDIVGVSACTTWPQWLEHVHAQDRDEVARSVELQLSGRSTQWEHECRVRRPSGETRWVVCRGIVERTADGHASRFTGSLADVTEARTSSALTGLPNRLRFLDVVDACLARQRRYPDYAFGVAMISMDRWELTKDTLGVGAADALVRELAARLTAVVRENDAVAHLGANEFGVLLDGARTAADCASVAERVRARCAPPLEYGGTRLPLRTSMGIALADCSYTQADQVLRDAGIAAAEARNSVVDDHRVFSAGMREALLTRAETEVGLRTAIETGALALQYQPIVDLRSGRVEGLEALVRWPHPTRGLLSPAAFLAVAEETGLVVPLGRWCLLEACRAVAEWRRAGGPSSELSVSVNVSPVQFQYGDLVSDVHAALAASGLPASALKIEVTETAVMRDPVAARNILTALSRIGVQLALDDFGVGHSTLSYLSEFTVHALKIDRSFVSRLPDTRDDREIVKAVVALARRLGVSVTAEGIETVGQLTELQTLDCAMGQGYYLARPMDASSVVSFVETAEASRRGASCQEDERRLV